ncbi:MAG TPA: glycosyltransferase, partial [Xanthomonadales bacterium]|nr:glycosyltransferase [Xanthomonadales bacterium]
RFISLLDNDDLWMPSYLAAVRAAFEGAPDAGLAYSDVWILDDASKRIHRRTGLEFFAGRAPERLDGERFLLEILAQNFITASTVTVRRVVIDRIGGFDASVRGVDDYDLWVRIAAAGFGAVRPPGCQAILRDRPGSVSKNQVMMLRSLHDVLQRAASNTQLPAGARAVAEARVPGIDESVRALERHADPAALRLRARRALAQLKIRLRKPFDMRRSAPPEVAAALHDAGER